MGRARNGAPAFEERLKRLGCQARRPRGRAGGKLLASHLRRAERAQAGGQCRLAFWKRQLRRSWHHAPRCRASRSPCQPGALRKSRSAPAAAQRTCTDRFIAMDFAAPPSSTSMICCGMCPAPGSTFRYTATTFFISPTPPAPPVRRKELCSPSFPGPVLPGACHRTWVSMEHQTDRLRSLRMTGSTGSRLTPAFPAACTVREQHPFDVRRIDVESSGDAAPGRKDHRCLPPKPDGKILKRELRVPYWPDAQLGT